MKRSHRLLSKKENRKIGTFTVSEWQVARVYSLLGMPESALYHSKRCLAIIEKGGAEFEDFHLPSAYEGLARAYSSAGDARNAKKYATLARKHAVKISDSEDKKTIMEQIQSLHIPDPQNRKRSL